MSRRLLLSANSRYQLTPYFSRRISEKTPSTGSVQFFGTFVAPEISPGNDDALYTMRESDNGRLDLVAYRYYGTSELWWVIALVNGIADPLQGVDAGTVLTIPRLKKVFSALTEGEF